MHNPRGFTNEEYGARCRTLQAAMAAAEIDLALFTTPAEFYYYCGLQTPFWHSPTRPWFLLLPAEGLPLAVVPAIGAPLMQRCRLRELRTWDSPQPADEGVSLLAATLRDMTKNRAGAAPHIGMMRGRQSVLRMPPADFERVCAALPDLRLSDISATVQQQRMVKSAAEIGKITAACDAASAAFAGWQEWLREGMALSDIAREFQRECLRHGADNVPYLSCGMGAGGYADIISPPDTRAWGAGDVLLLDTGCVFDGYHCDFDRNIACRHASDEVLRCHETLWRATEAGLQAARAGVTCAQVFGAMHEVIYGAGDGDDNQGGGVGRYGHGLGIELTETPSIAAWDDTPLAAGMVLTLEPSAFIENSGGERLLAHEENIVITGDGARLLSQRAPERLPIVQTSLQK